MPQVPQKTSLFRWILFLWIGLVYLWGIQLGGVVREQISSDRIFLFTLLMLLHFSLYGISPFLTLKTARYKLLLYFLFQCLLIVCISMVAHRQTVTIGLYLALLGEMTGFLSKKYVAIALVTACLFLFTLNMAILYGWAYARLMLLYVAPLSLIMIGYVLLFIRQAHAHARTQELLHDLEAAHQQLASASVRLEDLSRVAERRRMARELHDTLAQGLAGLSLQLEAVKSHLTDGHYARAQEIVEQAMRRTRSSLATARSAIDDLRSTAFTSSHLQQALKDEIDHFTSATGIPCTTNLSSLIISDPLCEHVVRIVSEGLMNVAQHAQAHQVWVHVVGEDTRLTIEIRDNGIGFDAATLSQHGHYGLLGLRERTRLLGGQFLLISAPGQGTTLRLLLPAEKKGEEA